jgi:hypothetical protein
MGAFDEVDAQKAKRQRCRELTKEITSRRVAIWKDEYKLVKHWAEATKQSLLQEFFALPVFWLPRILYHWLSGAWLTQGFWTTSASKRERYSHLSKN